MRVFDLATPQVLVDRASLLRNIERKQAGATSRGLRLRPHAKTHKSPVIASWQIARGAAGICCAKVGEAEVFAEAGVEDIRLPYPIQPANARRVLALMDRTRLSIIVDHLGVARAWSQAMQEAGRSLDVLIKVDVGFHRCGIDPDPPKAMPFIQAVDRLPGLRLLGLLSHAGHAYHAHSPDEAADIARAEAALLRELARRARAAGIGLSELSVGSTPTARFSLDEPDLTELRPGNYVFYDRSQVALGSASLADCALTVLATVVSRPADDRIILDCGSKTLSSDQARGAGNPQGYGLVFPDPEADAPDEGLSIERLSEEHAVVRRRGDAADLQPGDRVRVLPNHACVVVNLQDCLRLVDGTTLVESLPVAARGRIA